MKNRKVKKQPLTLLEIMIVIFLIGLIGSVIGYNMKGSLDEGKAFRTKQGAAQLRDLLLLEVAKNEITLDEAIENPAKCLKQIGMAKNPEKLLNDGWEQPYTFHKQGDHDFSLTSKKYNEYRRKKGLEPEEL
jgi:general secretion pathway protein G